MNELLINETIETQNIIEVPSDTNNTTVLHVAQSIYSVLSVISFLMMIVFIYKYLKAIIKYRR